MVGWLLYAINLLAEHRIVFGYKVCAEYARTFCAFLAVSHTEKAPRNLILEAHPSLKWQLFFACAGIGRWPIVGSHLSTVFFGMLVNIHFLLSFFCLGHLKHLLSAFKLLVTRDYLVLVPKSLQHKTHLFGCCSHDKEVQCTSCCHSYLPFVHEHLQGCFCQVNDSLLLNISLRSCRSCLPSSPARNHILQDSQNGWNCLHFLLL